MVSDATGKELDGAYVKLKVLKGQEDSFVLADQEFKVCFFPDYLAAGLGEAQGRSSPAQVTKDFTGGSKIGRDLDIVNPAFVVTVPGKGGSAGATLLRPGEFLVFDSYKLYLADLEYWVLF